MKLREMLQARVAAFATFGHPALMERFVLKNGGAFKGVKFPFPKQVRRGEPNGCFMNAARLIMNNPREEWTYHEGYVLRDGLPLEIHHAWIVVDGKVVDNTLTDPEECEFLGVPFTRYQLMSELARNKVFGLLDTGRGVNRRLIAKLDPAVYTEARNVIEAGREIRKVMNGGGP
jgi:hypothetical protein